MGKKITLINILKNNQLNILDSFLKSREGRDLALYDIHLEEIIKNNRLRALQMLINNKWRKIHIIKLHNYKICDLIVEYQCYEIANLLFSIMTIDNWEVYCDDVSSIIEYILSMKYHTLYEIIRKHNLIDISLYYCRKLFLNMDIDMILLLHRDSLVDKSKDSCIGLSVMFETIYSITYWRHSEEIKRINKEIIPLAKFNFGFIRTLHCMFEHNTSRALLDMRPIAYNIREFLYGF